jgi:hypothetical protein
MADAGFVSRRQSFSDLRSYIDYLEHGELAFLERGAKRLACHEFGDHPPITHVVNADNSGMVESGDRAGFLLEALLAHRVCAVFRRKQFHGDFPVQARIAGAKDLSHSSGAKGTDNLVGADLLGRRRGHEV